MDKFVKALFASLVRDPDKIIYLFLKMLNNEDKIQVTRDKIQISSNDQILMAEFVS